MLAVVDAPSLLKVSAPDTADEPEATVGGGSTFRAAGASEPETGAGSETGGIAECRADVRGCDDRESGDGSFFSGGVTAVVSSASTFETGVPESVFAFDVAEEVAAALEGRSGANGRKLSGGNGARSAAGFPTTAGDPLPDWLAM